MALLIASLLLVTTSSLHAEEKLFPLGIWYEGGVGDARDNVLPKDPAKAAAIYEKNFADIAAHGINLVVIPNSPPEHHKLVLDTAQKHGLKIILELGLDGGPFGDIIRNAKPMDEKLVQETLENVLGPIKDHPALYRVQLIDEPPAQGFADYGKIAAAMRKFNPRTEPFCCLTGGSDGDKFLAEAKSDVVAFDAYPFGPNAKPGDIDALRGFAQVSAQFQKWGAKNNANAWAVVQCHAITGQLRFPTAAELSAMTWAALAEGNHGVFWFLYQSEAVGQAMMDGLVDRDFKSRPLWDEVSELTGKIGPLTPILSDLRDPKELKTDEPMLLARTLSDSRGNHYVIVVNLDALNPHSFKQGAAEPLEIAPGDGKLLRVPAAQ